MLCECKEQFDFETAVILKYGNQIENFKFKAKVRLGDICSETCMLCLNYFKKGNYNPSNTQNGNLKIKIFQEAKKESVINYNISHEDHLICKKCIDLFKNENRSLLKNSKNG